jgi:tetratricopeptide (TPR) repeat protein
MNARFRLSQAVAAIFIVCAYMITAHAQARTPAEQAIFHYKVGLVALKNNDTDTAIREFTEAHRLAPQNADVLYNLALLESQRGNTQAALDFLRRALAAGLPPEARQEAEDLEVNLTYNAKREENKFGWLVGSWRSNVQGVGDHFELTVLDVASGRAEGSIVFTRIRGDQNPERITGFYDAVISEHPSAGLRLNLKYTGRCVGSLGILNEPRRSCQEYFGKYTSPFANLTRLTDGTIGYRFNAGSGSRGIFTRGR